MIERLAFVTCAVWLTPVAARADSITDAVCGTHVRVVAQTGRARPLDLHFEGRRCSFGFIPDDVVPTFVTVSGERHDVAVKVESQSDVADVEMRAAVAKASAQIDARIAGHHAGAYVVIPQAPRSDALKMLGVLSMAVSGFALLGSGLSAFAAGSVNTLRFCFSPCAPIDTTPYVVTGFALFASSIAFGITGGVLYLHGKQPVANIDALVTPNGLGLRVRF